MRQASQVPSREAVEAAFRRRVGGRTLSSTEQEAIDDELERIGGPSAQKRSLDAAMGLGRGREPHAVGNRVVYPAMTRPERQAWLEKRATNESANRR